MSEAESWNRKVLAEAMRAMGALAHLVETVAVHGLAPFPMELSKVARGLDALAKHRGIG